MSELKHKTIAQLIDEDRGGYLAVANQSDSRHEQRTFATFGQARDWLRLQQTGGAIHWRDAEGRHERRIGPSSRHVEHYDSGVVYYRSDSF